MSLVLLSFALPPSLADAWTARRLTLAELDYLPQSLLDQMGGIDTDHGLEEDKDGIKLGTGVHACKIKHRPARAA